MMCGAGVVWGGGRQHCLVLGATDGDGTSVVPVSYSAPQTATVHQGAGGAQTASAPMGVGAEPEIFPTAPPCEETDGGAVGNISGSPPCESWPHFFV